MSEIAKNSLPVSLEQEMRNSYLDYAMSVIVGRALPDVRDGLKPVHRRVLFAMNQLKNDWNKPYKKSARVVGDVIGKYHPHGDSAVYETIVRMAQSFSLRYMLVDGQGNFGSIDGDNAAAMRYTEVRLTKIAHDLLEDLEKETVDFDKSKISEDAISILNVFIEELRGKTYKMINILGHADALGSDTYNLKLSLDRAQSVKNYLVVNGIDENLIFITALGESSPIANNDTREGRALNRRVFLETR